MFPADFSSIEKEADEEVSLAFHLIIVFLFPLSSPPFFPNALIDQASPRLQRQEREEEEKTSSASLSFSESKLFFSLSLSTSYSLQRASKNVGKIGLSAGEQQQHSTSGTPAEVKENVTFDKRTSDIAAD